jgi:Flp pilus assembly protein TadG
VGRESGTVSVAVTEMVTAGELLERAADHAARAGLHLLDARLAEPELGPTIRLGAQTLVSACTSLMDDFVLSAVGLGGAVQTSSALYLTVDTDTAYRLAGFG